MTESEIIHRTQGMLDIQVNGFAGVDYNNPNLESEEYEQSLQKILSTGVTNCMPTLISASEDHLASCFSSLEKGRRDSSLAQNMVLGYHLEGPFLSKQSGFRGCHPPEAMCAGDLNFFDRLQEIAGGMIRMVTVAPEIKGVLPLIETLSSRGIIVSLGHTSAGLKEIRQATEAGAVLSTHLGNGTATMLSKHDNPILAQLSEDRLSAGFIADGYHLSKEQLQLYLRAKGLNRSILVTDATAAAAATPGIYGLGSMKLERQKEPVAFAPDTGRPAGSAVTLDQCVQNMIDWFDLSLDEAVNLASHNPRKMMEVISPKKNSPEHWISWKNENGRWKVFEAQCGAFSIQNQ
jgi:N-acetylglucosamine-6-phosphate deacetylase